MSRTWGAPARLWRGGRKRKGVHRGTRHVPPPPALSLGGTLRTSTPRTRRSCGGRCRGRATGRGAGLGLRGPGGARPHRHATTAAAAAAVFVHLALRWGRNWAARWHLAQAVGKRFRGCRAKRLYVYRIHLNRGRLLYNGFPFDATKPAIDKLPFVATKSAIE